MELNIKPKQYVVNIASIKQSDKDLVGYKALHFHTLEKSGIALPLSFAITSTAFDDFLIANDLIDFIAPRINELDLSNDKIAAKVSFEIGRAIEQGKIPDIILNPVLRAYHGLAGNSNPFVRITNSQVDQLLEEDMFVGISSLGEEEFCKKLKKAWASFFSAQALQHRARINYEGYLTTAVWIQKVYQAEVSGTVYTVNPADNNTQIAEIQAYYGLENSVEPNLTSDVYWGDKNTEEIVDRKIVNQEWMWVKSIKKDSKDAYMKIKISPSWKSKQKLDDKGILYLLAIGKKIEHLFNAVYQVLYAVEGGKIYVYDLYPLKNIPMPHVSRLQGLADEQFMIESAEKEYVQAAMPVEQEEPKQTGKGKTMEDYVNEVQKLQKNPVDQPQLLKPQISSQQDELKHLNQLTKVLAGKAKGDSCVYGKIHFIYSAKDWETLDPQSIIALNTINIRHLALLNQVKGIIVASPVERTLLARINVPVIFEVDEVFSVLHDQEVITLDARTGSIYLGSGIEDPLDTLPESDIQDSVSLKVEPPPPPKEDKVLSTIMDLKFKELTVVEKDEKLPVANTNFMQMFDPAEAKLDSRFDGTIVRIDDYLKLAGINFAEVLQESKRKVQLLDQLATTLKNISQINLGKPLIIVLGSQPSIDLQSKTSGSEYLLVDNKQLYFQLELISILRNRESQRNVWVAFPACNDEHLQTEMKKHIISFGFRRSSTFKLLSEIDKPLGLVNIKSLVANEIDGVIFNIDQILSELYQKDSFNLEPGVLNFISWAIHMVSSNKTKAYWQQSTPGLLNDDDWKRLIEKGMSNMIIRFADLAKYKVKISELELKQLDQHKKRGRKKKDIDFGY